MRDLLIASRKITERSKHVFIVWFIVLIFIVNAFDSAEYACTYEGRMCVILSCFVIGITALFYLTISAASLRNDDGVFVGLHRSVGGILLITMVTNGLLAWGPTPSMLDPFTGSPVHLVRQLEWIALAYLIAYVIAMLDPDDHKSEPARIRDEVTDSVENALSAKEDAVACESLAHQSGLEAAACASSALFGLLTSSPVAYAAIMSTSCFIFTRLLIRHFGNRSHYKPINFDILQNLDDANELSAKTAYSPVLQMRINIAANWAGISVVGWPLIVLNYFGCFRVCFPESMDASVYVDCILEVVAKALMAASVVNAHESDLRLQMLIEALIGRIKRDKEILDLKEKNLRMEVALRNQEFKGICPTLISFWHMHIYS